MIFTPPTLAEVPTYGSFGENVKAARLAKYLKPRSRGVAVYKMEPGNIYFLGRDVPGLEIDVIATPFGAPPPVPTPFRVGVQLAREPSQALPKADQVNNTQAQVWLMGRMIADLPQVPDVMYVYYGGTSYQVDDNEASLLAAAGFGAYLS